MKHFLLLAALVFFAGTAFAYPASYVHAKDFDYLSLYKTAGEDVILVHPTIAGTLFRGTWGGGVLKSADGGKSWIPKNNGLPSLFVESLAFDPSNSNILFAGMRGHIWSNGGILYKSLDGGVYWLPVSGTVCGGNPFNVNPCAMVEAIEIDPTNSNRLYFGMVINACNVHAQSCGGYYRSVDGGNSFLPNAGCSVSRTYNPTTDYPSNDATIVRVNPSQPNELYVMPGYDAHAELTAMNTSLDYGDTVQFLDVVDTRNSFLPASEQYVSSLMPNYFDFFPQNPGVRYAVHGGALVKRRSDNIADPILNGGEPWDIPVKPIVVRFNGEKSSSAVDGVEDNDLDQDNSADNVWKPIFSLDSLPGICASWCNNPSYPTSYSVGAFAVSPWDENRLFLAVYGTAYFDLYNAIQILELTPDSNDQLPWHYRVLYEFKDRHPPQHVQVLKLDPTTKNRIYFVERNKDPNSGPNQLTEFKSLQSLDDGVTWNTTTLSSDYPYFHASEIKEFELAGGGTRMFLVSTMGLRHYRVGTSVGDLWWSNNNPQGFFTLQGLSFSTITQSPLDKNVFFAKGPRFVAQSHDGGLTFKYLDEIEFELGRYYPTVFAPDACDGYDFKELGMCTTVINALAVDPIQPDVLFAGSDAGLWRNEKANASGNICFGENSVVNVSQSWQKISSNGFANDFVWSLTFDPNDRTGKTMWTGTRDGLYKSVDRGVSWNHVFNINDAKQIEFSQSAMLLASNHGLYKSVDGGVSWNSVLNAPINRISNRIHFPEQWLSATAQGMYRSNDSGNTWRSMEIAFQGNVDAALFTTSPQGIPRAYYTGLGDALYKTDIVFERLILAKSFDGSTTDFASLSKITENNIVLEKSAFGKISFQKPLSFSKDANLDQWVVISQNRIFLDSNRIPDFNRPAIIELRNLSVRDPVILMDGKPCDPASCVIQSYANETLAFTVRGFSEYSVIERQGQTWCGDGICQSLTESCSVCSIDCGSCKNPIGPGDQNVSDGNVSADQNKIIPTACVPSQELCDGVDNDCDALIDEVCAGYIPPCDNGKQDVGELGLDCGGVCANHCIAQPKENPLVLPYLGPQIQWLVDPAVIAIVAALLGVLLLKSIEWGADRKKRGPEL